MKKMKKQNKRRISGFTLIEFMLAMAFLGTLLVAIAQVTVRISDIYQKGLSVRAINMVGQNIISDLTKSIGSTSYLINIYDTDSLVSSGEDKITALTFLTDDNIRDLRQNYFIAGVVDDSSSDNDQQVFGVFCSGYYTYIWNTALALKDDTKGVLINNHEYRLARIYDREQNHCKRNGVSGKSFASTVITKDSSGKEEINVNKVHELSTDSGTTVTELIDSNESNLALYDFTVLPAPQSHYTDQAFVSITFILATLKGGVNILSSGDYCTGDDETLASIGGGDAEFNLNEFNYCAINKFNFSMRTGGNENKRKSE